MRRVRGGKNKDLGLLVNMALVLSDDWLTYLLVFLCALFGVLVGMLIGKVPSVFFILLTVFSLTLLITGLFIAWAINRKNRILEAFTLKEIFKEQYNALSLLIDELEYNLNAENAIQVRSTAWQELKNKYVYFPTYIYDDLLHFYNYLPELNNVDVLEFRRIINEDLDLPSLIAQLKEWQLKIKRQLPYFE
ncbi:MAG: hypothetical protein GXW85_03000 [Clostridia bacterium]|nr:hypothetical protein [Clostridia bacterium]